MPNEIVLDPNAILVWAGAIAGVGAAIGYLIKAAKPLAKPFQRLQKEVKDLEDHSTHCDEKFKNDQLQLEALKRDVDDIKMDVKMILEASLLNMKHIETGNCTGEVAEGRMKLEKYLINR